MHQSQFRLFYNTKHPLNTTKDSYIKSCTKAISAIQSGKFTKVVYSRVIKNSYQGQPLKTFQEIADEYPNAFVYLISIEDYGVWMGASPESFLKIENSNLSTTALAGTKTDPQMPWGEKEIEEQAMVSKFIVSELTNAGATELNKVGPYTFDTGAVLHLKTDINCNISKNKIDHIIKQLHPTPAICGLPQNKSNEFIREIESHTRTLYAGFLGPATRKGLNLFVNLRCMQILSNYAYIYVGGGLTKDSVAELEWLETENKAKTLTKFLS